MIRKILLIGMVVLMLAVMVLTWGSVGSAVMGYGLIMLAASLAYQRFITHREESDYQMED